MAYAGEVFAQLLTVQAYAQEEGELRRYSRLLGEADSKQQAVTIFHKGWTAGFHLLTNSAMVLAACYAGTLASRGQLEPGSLVSFTQLSWRIGEAIGQLLFLTGEATNTADAVARLQAIIEREPRIPSERGATIARDSPFLRGERPISNHAHLEPRPPRTTPTSNHAHLEPRPPRTTPTSNHAHLEPRPPRTTPRTRGSPRTPHHSP